MCGETPPEIPTPWGENTPSPDENKLFVFWRYLFFRVPDEESQPSRLSFENICMCYNLIENLPEEQHLQLLDDLEFFWSCQEPMPDLDDYPLDAMQFDMHRLVRDALLEVNNPTYQNLMKVADLKASLPEDVWIALFQGGAEHIALTLSKHVTQMDLYGGYQMVYDSSCDIPADQVALEFFCGEDFAKQVRDHLNLLVYGAP